MSVATVCFTVIAWLSPSPPPCRGPPGSVAENECGTQSSAGTPVHHARRGRHRVAGREQALEDATVDVEHRTVDRRARAALGAQSAAVDLHRVERGRVEGTQRRPED